MDRLHLFFQCSNDEAQGIINKIKKDGFIKHPELSDIYIMSMKDWRAVCKTRLHNILNSNNQQHEFNALSHYIFQCDITAQLRPNTLYKVLADGQDDEGRYIKFFLLSEINLDDIPAIHADAINTEGGQRYA